MLKKILLLSLVAISTIAWTFTTPPNYDKIQKEVLLELQAGEQVELFVLFEKQAPTHITDNWMSKKEKGIKVFSTLKEIARTTQQPVIELLNQKEISYHSFYLVNAVLCTVDLATAEHLTTLPGVAQLLSNPETPITRTFEEQNTALRGEPEWGVLKIGADQVWETGVTGEGVVVAGADTGVEWDHPALKTHYRGWDGSNATHDYNWHDGVSEINPLNGDAEIDPSNNPCGLSSIVPCDDHRHGTHTVGTMIGDDGGDNQIGVAPGAKWIACRNMERGWGSPATYLDCFEWFLAPTDTAGENPLPEKAPHVINNSWGCPEVEGCNTENLVLFETAVNNLKEAGIVVVVSAGNDGPDCHTIANAPAVIENSFVVGATNQVDTITGFSSRGTVTFDGSMRLKPNVAAPGRSVRSAILNAEYGTSSGTSMAGPHVAGLVALMISANPDLAGQVDIIEDIIEQTAVPVLSDQDCGGISGLEVPNAVYGYGRINAVAAVEQAQLWVNTVETPKDINLTVYPNPFAEQFTMLLPESSSSFELRVLNTKGQQILTKSINQNDTEVSISLDNMPSGIYYYELSFEETTAYGKVVKM